MIGRLIAATSPGLPSEMYGSFWSLSGVIADAHDHVAAVDASRPGAARSVAVWPGSMSGSVSLVPVSNVL